MERPEGDIADSGQLPYGERVAGLRAAWESGKGFHEDDAVRLGEELQELQGSLTLAGGNTEGLGEMIDQVAFMAGETGNIVLAEE